MQVLGKIDIVLCPDGTVHCQAKLPAPARYHFAAVMAEAARKMAAVYDRQDAAAEGVSAAPAGFDPLRVDLSPLRAGAGG